MRIESYIASVLAINAPEWFRDPEFVTWLNTRVTPLMTWHTTGEPPNEWSDIIVFVDPSLSGEGSDNGSMPDKYWDEIVRLCQNNYDPYGSSTGYHIVVRITNLLE